MLNKWEFVSVYDAINDRIKAIENASKSNNHVGKEIDLHNLNSVKQKMNQLGKGGN